MQQRLAFLIIVVGLAGLGLAGCAAPSPQQGRIGNLEYALVEVRDRQDRLAEEFRERLESMEQSLLQQERFLQDTFTLLEASDIQTENLSRSAATQIIPDPVSEKDLDPLPRAVMDSQDLQPDVAVSVPAQPAPRETVELEARPAPSPAAGLTPVDRAPHVRTLPGNNEAKLLYDQALARYFRGEYSRARADFLDFLERFPDHHLVPNALYWQAETHYAQKQFVQSILVFKELSRRFPNSAKAPDALLKAGFAYEQLGDYPNARFHLQIVINDHPDSAAAQLAMERLPLLSSPSL
ncbi:tol-pal system protein YbgF [Desulfonatronum thioautotrophicum]|uniref:tol-pal system protein YbgF n=1 Tax=Desulfonatronum thioautotrophicum TaxID=617001 RepID=UPI00069A8FC0|nr:tol-pal system protein YbgF [Desulfonatronum thioautotrophicum]